MILDSNGLPVLTTALGAPLAKNLTTWPSTALDEISIIFASA